jgi:hypothetical protein
MKRSRSRVIPILWVVGLCATAVTAAADYPVTHGRQIIINRGIQLQSMVLQFDGVHSYPNFSSSPSGVQLWQSAGFTTFNLWNEPDTNGSVLPNLPPGQQWGKIWGSDTWSDSSPLPLGIPAMNSDNHWGIYPSELPYAANLVDLQWSDEANDTMSHLASVAALFRTWNQNYPQALAHANFCDRTGCSHPLDDSSLSTYIQQTQPDILTFDQYPPFQSYVSYGDWYFSMQKYRLQALAGYTTSSGANSGPLPYGQFMNMWRSGGDYSAESVNESFVNLQHFASLAFGYTWLSTYLYNRYTGSYPVFFVADGVTSGDQYPDYTVFGFEQHANSQTMNLSNYFKRAVSTGVFYMSDSSGAIAPSNMSAWRAKCGAIPQVADDYVVAIKPYTNSTANGGVAAPGYPYAIVGYFMPLQYMHDYGHAFANGLHFMLVNGNAGDRGTADDYGQWFHVVFDFTGSSNNSLLRLNRTTGQVELVPLVDMGNNHYYLDLYLPGGVGDVFAFWNSRLPVPGMQDKQMNIVPVITTVLQ